MKRKFFPTLRRQIPHHYLIQPIPCQSLEFIKNTAKQLPYFLKFDIRLYYPSINHQILIKEIADIYPKITGNNLSRRFKRKLKNDIPDFLSQSPYNNGLPIGSPLSYALGGIFLLGLDFQINNFSKNKLAFLRQTDDYLVFCHHKNEPKKVLQEIISPKLKQLGLEINTKKLRSGKFNQNRVNFIGFDYYAGYFTIGEEKIEAFSKKVVKLTHLTRKTPEKAVVKTLNNKILGFGHYYKHASCRTDYKKLDSFIRMRLRRWLLNQKEVRLRQGNLVLTNRVLENLGLKSLVEIKEKFDAKNNQINTKKRKKKPKTGYMEKLNQSQVFDILEVKHQQKMILEKLENLTTLVEKLDKKIG